jgi:CBS domain-containing protein
MKVRDAMSAEVELANPSQTIREAALRMLECDIGALPVGEHDRLVGMLTDRDIAVRAVAVGLSPDAPISEVVSLGDVAVCEKPQTTGKAVAGVSVPGGSHSQATH